MYLTLEHAVSDDSRKVAARVCIIGNRSEQIQIGNRGRKVYISAQHSVQLLEDPISILVKQVNSGPVRSSAVNESSKLQGKFR
jgi:hypothetical protein